MQVAGYTPTHCLSVNSCLYVKKLVTFTEEEGNSQYEVCTYRCVNVHRGILSMVRVRLGTLHFQCLPWCNRHGWLGVKNQCFLSFQGHGDACFDGMRAGCVELLSTIQQRVKPLYHVFGHIHEGMDIVRLSFLIFHSFCMRVGLLEKDTVTCWHVHFCLLVSAVKEHFIFTGTVFKQLNMVSFYNTFAWDRCNLMASCTV